MGCKYEDKYWDELPPPLQKAAATLGFTQKLWDADGETVTCNLEWHDLTHEQQKAARLLGYTPREWALDEGDDSSTSSSESEEDTPNMDGGRGISWIEQRIKTLETEIAQRQNELTTLVGSREGSAYADMLKRHEDCVNAHLQRRITDFHPDLLQSHEPPKLERSNKQLIQNTFLHEYHHTLPGFLSMILHCLLYITLYGFVAKLTHIVGEEIFGSDEWDVIHNNYDDINEKNLFYMGAIVLSFVVARVTGGVHDWNESRAYRRKWRFHARNRWHLQCWDMPIINWFSGGDVSEMYSEHAQNSSTRTSNKWGPRLKSVLDIFSFFLLYCSVDHFVTEMGPKSLLNVRDTVLEGLPSRQLHLQWTRSSMNDMQQCVGGGDKECPNVAMTEADFMSDIMSWILNSNRCGWGPDDNGKADSSFQMPDNESMLFPASKGTAPKLFRPWKQPDDEWRRTLNVRDDEYLRANLSLDSYYSLVGDPYACFTDPVTELVFHAVITGISFGCMHWLEVPFLLI
ncbi:hypothetical protein ACHAXT_005819 [Thalassiosira profunda]